MTTEIETENYSTKASAFEIFRKDSAPTLQDAGKMSIGEVTEDQQQGLAQLFEAGIDNGSVVKTLFSRPGFSLTHAWFKSGYPLPPHNHNTDCLYFVVAGTLQLGRETLSSGDGFFVKAGKNYSFVPGDGGVEVLEFRTEEEFDIRFLAKSASSWTKLAGKISDKQIHWETETKPPSHSL